MKLAPPESHRPYAGYLALAAVVLSAVLVGVATGIRLGARAKSSATTAKPGAAPAAGHPALAMPPAAPVTPVASAAPHAEAAASADWADSVEIPDWVRSAGVGAGVPRRRYVRLGEMPASMPAQPAGDAGGTAPVRSAPSPTVVDLATIRPLLVQRLSGSRVVFRDVGLGRAGVEPGVWAVPGHCATRLSLEDLASGAGSEVGRMGDWIFALAVPVWACTAASRHAVTRHVPESRERDLLAYAVQTSALVQDLRASLFRPSDLKDLAVASVAGRRMAWGVFRGNANTTQIYPPPPHPQLAFAAREEEGGRWVIVWAKYAASADETLGLAGVYDYDRNGGPDVFFGVRTAAGGRLLHVVGTAAGDWKLLRSVNLGN
ncbi:MAG TPA: hypothetical protein VF178_02240 [Gemmatimonadaceae bacterium]